MAKVISKRQKPDLMTSLEVWDYAIKEGLVDTKTGKLTSGPLHGATLLGFIQFARDQSWDWPYLMMALYHYWGIDEKFHDPDSDETCTMHSASSTELIEALVKILPENVEPDEIGDSLEFDT